MLRACALLIALACLGSPAVAGADQTDPRLDSLFERLQSTEDTQEGLRISRQIRTIWRETPDREARLHFKRGIRDTRLGYYDKALRAFNRAIEESPRHAEIWNRRAVLFYIRGEYGRAVSDLERTLALEPRHYGALSELGAIYMLREQYEAALEVLQKALDVNPHLSGARRNIETIRHKLADQVS